MFSEANIYPEDLKRKPVLELWQPLLVLRQKNKSFGLFIKLALIRNSNFSSEVWLAESAIWLTSVWEPFYSLFFLTRWEFYGDSIGVDAVFWLQNWWQIRHFLSSFLVAKNKNSLPYKYILEYILEINNFRMISSDYSSEDDEVEDESLVLQPSKKLPVIIFRPEVSRITGKPAYNRA